MYKIYIIKNTYGMARSNFDSNKLLLWDPESQSDIYSVIGPTGKEELNKAASLEFTMLPTNIRYNSLTRKATSVFLYDDDTLLFEGRVSGISTDFYKQRKVVCEGTLAYLADTLQPGDQVKTTDKNNQTTTSAREETILAHVQRLVDYHNTQIGDDKKLSVGSVVVYDTDGTTDIASTKTKKFDSSGWRSTWDAFQEDLIDKYGGYVTIDSSSGSMVLSYTPLSATENPSSISFGVNMMEMSEEEDTDDEIFTILYPLGADEVTLSEKYMNVSNAAIKKYGKIYRVEQFDDASTEAELRTRAQEFINEKFRYTPNYNVKAIDLYHLDASDKRISVGQTVLLKSKWHSLDKSDLYVTTADYDYANPENDSFTIGDPKQDKESKSKTLSGQTSSTSRRASSAASAASSSSRVIATNLDNYIKIVGEKLQIQSEWNATVVSKSGEMQTQIDQNAERVLLAAQALMGGIGEEEEPWTRLSEFTVSDEGIKGIVAATAENESMLDEQGNIIADHYTLITQNETMIRQEAIDRQNGDNELSGVITQTASTLRSEYKNADEGLSSTITQTAGQIRTELSDEIEGVNSTITQTASTLRSEYESADKTLKSSITQTNKKIQTEITDRTNADNVLQTQITQNADSIALKVSAGDVATQLTVECGNVSITNGNLYVDGVVTADAVQSAIGKMDYVVVKAIHASKAFSIGDTVASGLWLTKDKLSTVVQSFGTITTSGTTVSIPYTMLDGSSGILTFDKVASISGSWSGNKFTATKSANGSSSVSTSIYLNGDGNDSDNFTVKVNDGTNTTIISKYVYLVLDSTKMVVYGYLGTSTSDRSRYGSISVSSIYSAGVSSVTLSDSWSSNTYKVTASNKETISTKVYAGGYAEDDGTDSYFYAQVYYYDYSTDSAGVATQVHKRKLYLVEDSSNKKVMVRSANSTSSGNLYGTISTTDTYNAGYDAGKTAGLSTTISATGSWANQMYTVKATNGTKSVSKSSDPVYAEAQGSAQNSNFSAVAYYVSGSTHITLHSTTLYLVEDSSNKKVYVKSSNSLSSGTSYAAISTTDTYNSVTLSKSWSSAKTSCTISASNGKSVTIDTNYNDVILNPSGHTEGNTAEEPTISVKMNYGLEFTVAKITLDNQNAQTLKNFDSSNKKGTAAITVGVTPSFGGDTSTVTYKNTIIVDASEAYSAGMDHLSSTDKITVPSAGATDSTNNISTPKKEASDLATAIKTLNSKFAGRGYIYFKVTAGDTSKYFYFAVG